MTPRDAIYTDFFRPSTHSCIKAAPAVPLRHMTGKPSLDIAGIKRIRPAPPGLNLRSCAAQSSGPPYARPAVAATIIREERVPGASSLLRSARL